MMKRLVQLPMNIAANLFVIAICPFLVLAWIIRVNLHDRAMQRSRLQAKLPEARVEGVAHASLMLDRPAR